MPVAYKNTRTGRVVELDEPDTLMDRSKKWQRVEQDDQADQSEEPKPADVRAWAKDNDIEVPARGKLSAEVVEAYKAAQQSEGDA